MDCTTHIVSKKRQDCITRFATPVRPLRFTVAFTALSLAALPYDDDRRSAHLLGRFRPEGLERASGPPSFARSPSKATSRGRCRRSSSTSTSTRSSGRATACTSSTCSPARCGKLRRRSCSQIRASRRRQQARASGKNVIFLFGNIHPPEPEAAEALLMVARELAARQAQGTARQSDRHHRADLQRRRHRHVRQPRRIARQRDAAHPRHARKLAGLDLNRDAREARDRRGERALPGAQRVGSGAASRRPSDGPRQPRLREHVWDDDRAGGARRGRATTRTTRCFRRYATWCARSSGSRSSRTRSSTRHWPPTGWSHDRGRLDGRGEVHRQRLRTCGIAWRSSRRRPVSRRSSGGSTRSTRTSWRCSSTPTRTRRRCGGGQSGRR